MGSVTCVDISLKNISAKSGTDTLELRGVIARKMLFAGPGDISREEEKPFKHTIIVPGVLPEMYVTIQPETDGKPLVFTSSISQIGSVVEQQLAFHVPILIWRFRHLHLPQATGMSVHLDQLVCETQALKTFDHEIYLDDTCTVPLDLEYSVVHIESELIPDKIIVKGIIQYKVTQLTSDQEQVAKICVIPFFTILDANGILSAQEGHVVVASGKLSYVKKAPSKIAATLELHLCGKVYEKQILSIDARYLQTL
jgi:hypothetical protein